MPEPVQCESFHRLVPARECPGVASYMWYTCGNPKGKPMCAPMIEDPVRGYAKRYQDKVDDGEDCRRCGRPVRICWSWIPI